MLHILKNEVRWEYALKSILNNIGNYLSYLNTFKGCYHTIL